MRIGRMFAAITFSLMMAVSSLFAQRAMVVNVAPDHADWTYEAGDELTFNVSVTKSNVPVGDMEVDYELMMDMMPAFKKGTIKLKNGEATIKAGKFDEPGFVRCRVTARDNGYTYSGMATGGFDPYSIEPTTTDPEDFDKFWDDAKAELSRVAMNPILTLMPERCTSKSDVYHVSIQNIGNSRIYGILTMPKKPGKYPAILLVPGAGVRPYSGDTNTSDQGFITFMIGIHGIPVDMPQQVYNDLASGPLNSYMTSKLDDKDSYYYKRVYLGCVRALDFLSSLEEFDGQNLFVRGGSQGGALSIVTAGLDSRIKALVAYYPALCDLTGYMFGRAGGWPHLFNSDNTLKTKERIETTYYYDVVNFARRVKAPGFYSFGYNDTVCPPTSTFSAFNVITAPKELMIVPHTGHATVTEQTDRAWDWLRSQVK